MVQVFSGCFIGGEAASRAVSAVTNMTINMSPNRPGNKGLVNRHRLYLCQLSGLLNVITKNHLQKTNHTSLDPHSVFLMHTYDVARRTHLRRIIKLDFLMDIIRP